MEIRLNNSINGWIDISEENNGSLKLKVAHITRPQYYKLEQIMLNCGDIPTIVDEEKKKVLFDFKNMTSEQKSKAMSANREYMEYYIKFSVKEWYGFTSGGKDLPLKIVNNEMADDYWNLFMKQLTYKQLEAVFSKIDKEIGFGETELKK